MVTTKKRLLAYILSFVMALTVFGVLGLSNVSAEEAVPQEPYHIDKVYSHDKGENIDATKVIKQYTDEDLEGMVDVTSGYMEFTKQGYVNLYKIKKAVTFRKFLEDVGFSLDDLSAIKLYSDVTPDAFYGKAEYLSAMKRDNYFYDVTTKQDESGNNVIDWDVPKTLVEPMLSLDYGYYQFLPGAAGPLGYYKASTVPDSLFSDDSNRVFVGIPDPVKSEGFYSMQHAKTGMALIVDDYVVVRAGGDSSIYEAGDSKVVIPGEEGTYWQAVKGKKLAIFKAGDTVKTSVLKPFVKNKEINLTKIANIEDEITDLAECVVKVKSPQTYTGKAIIPSVTVTEGNGKFVLTKGEDYTVKCSNNVNAGIAGITITGKGYYKGTLNATFKIVPAKARIKATAKKKKAIVKVTNNTGAKKYTYAYRLKGAKKWKLKTSARKAFSFNRLKSGKKYQFKVKAVGSAGYSKVATVKIK